MSKNRIILAAVGGVIALAAAAAAVFVWLSYAAKTAAVEGSDEAEGLEAAVAKVQKLSRSPVYPGAASIKAVDTNAVRVAAWAKAVRGYAAAGDRAFEKTTPAAFKTFLVADAKRLAALPGTVAGALVQPEFAFGPFKPYIAEGKMPEEAKLAEFQRRWDDVATVVEALAAAGVCELTDVQFKDAAAAKPEEPAEDDRAARRRRARAKKNAKEAAAPAAPTAAFSYVFSFTARPPAFVKVLNALSTGSRFATVDDVSFRRVRDSLAEALGGGEKKAESAPSRRRGRRGRRAEPEQPAAGETPAAAANGIVADPLVDAPFAVTMAVTIHDFKSLEDAGAGSAGEEQK